MPALYDGRLFGHGLNYGGYRNPLVDAAIDRALAAPSVERAEIAWREAAREAMADVAAVPLIEERISQMLSSRVRHCVWSVLADGCNLTAIWLAPGAPARTARRP